MILESLQSANSTILDSVQATSNKQAAKAFKNQVIALSQCTSQLEQLLSLIKAMQEKKISSKVFTVEIKDSLQDAVDTCGQKTNDHTLDVSAVTGCVGFNKIYFVPLRFKIVQRLQNCFVFDGCCYNVFFASLLCIFLYA